MEPLQRPRGRRPRPTVSERPGAADGPVELACALRAHLARHHRSGRRRGRAEYDRRRDGRSGVSRPRVRAAGRHAACGAELAADLLPRRARSRRTGGSSAATVRARGGPRRRLRQETRASCEANVDQVLRLLRAGATPDGSSCRSRRGVRARPRARRDHAAGAARIASVCVVLGSGRGRCSSASTTPASSSPRMTRARRSCSPTSTGSTSWWRIRQRARSDGARRGASVPRPSARSSPRLDRRGARCPAARHELRRHHVALRVSSSPSEVRGLEARRAGGDARIREPLVVPSGVASLDVWWGAYERGHRCARALRAARGHPCRVGRVRPGVAGFRRSHSDAVHTARVAALAGDALGPVTSYPRVELVSLGRQRPPSAAVRRGHARAAGIAGRPGGAAARDGPRVPGRGAKPRASRRALRAPEHRGLSRQAGRAAGPAGQREPGRLTCALALAAASDPPAAQRRRHRM